jgi:CRP-like cAMP-binding protein
MPNEKGAAGMESHPRSIANQAESRHQADGVRHARFDGVPCWPTSQEFPQIENRLLRELPNMELGRLLGIAERVSLKPRQVLQERNLPLRYAYFPESAVASLQAWRGNGLSIEVRSVGRNDMTGLSILLGAARSPRRCIVQVPGMALRIPAASLEEFVDEYPRAKAVFLAYVHASIGHGAQVLACNSCHTVTERVARWLLTMSFQHSSLHLPVTHAGIARCLGIRRASVTNVVGHMEKQGLVRQERSLICLLRPEAIERDACECYRAIRDGYRRSRPAGGAAADPDAALPAPRHRQAARLGCN